MENIYYIGGSPCCGKSTIAKKISDEYGFYYYKADDYWMEFVTKGAKDGDEWLSFISGTSFDRLWLETPEKLNERELTTYEKLFPYFTYELYKLNKNMPVIAEGAAFLPNLVSKIGVGKTHYVCVVPTRDFQIQHYSKRSWVSDSLSSYSNKEEAFNNWMERDALFALSVLNQARKIDYTILMVDGSKCIEDNFNFVIKTFGLNNI